MLICSCPVLVGVICAAPSVEGAWWRAQVITFYKETDEVEIRYVDYGGYDRVKIDTLRQIRYVYAGALVKGWLKGYIHLKDGTHLLVMKWPVAG